MASSEIREIIFELVHSVPDARRAGGSMELAQRRIRRVPAAELVKIIRASQDRPGHLGFEDLLVWIWEKPKEFGPLGPNPLDSLGYRLHLSPQKVSKAVPFACIGIIEANTAWKHSVFSQATKKPAKSAAQLPHHTHLPNHALFNQTWPLSE
jgi:hypothetical protein